MGFRGLFLLLASVAAPAIADSDALGILDLNHDGRISRAEHSGGAEVLFRSLDANADGLLTPAELEIARRRPDGLPSGGPTPGELIAEIDRNGDELLSETEHAAAATAIFDRFDGDGDDFLSIHEIPGEPPTRPRPAGRAAEVPASFL